MQLAQFYIHLAIIRIIIATVVEVLLLVPIASPSWMTCKFAGEESNATKVGLWTGNVTDNHAVYFMMTGLRPIAMVSLLLSSAVLVGCVVTLVIRIRKREFVPSCKTIEAMTRTFIACEGVALITFLTATLNSDWIRKIYDCDIGWATWMLYFVPVPYVIKVVVAYLVMRAQNNVASSIAPAKAEENQGAEDPAPAAATETENQGAKDTATVATEADTAAT
ncbi:uncharacterized protein [Oscarella lobularis]|uniref:uncharacterized protein n=1 Tax=Oscarella lobularis TaxID=121494 RepID=UPI003313DBC4